MIILDCPVRIRHIHRIIGDQFRRLFHFVFPKPSAVVHFVYFSCARDFPLLSLSIESLARIDPQILGKVFVVVDSKGPFTVPQRQELQRIYSKLVFLELGQIDWASINTLTTEIKAFGIAAQQASPSDFIAKLDSDVLFLDSDKLREISISGAVFVGDGHYSSYAYAQGGLYLLRAHLAAELAQTVTVAELESAIVKCNTKAEDQVISELVRKRTKKLWLTRIMLFPDEFERANLRSRLVRLEFSALHFVHKKSRMKEFSDMIKTL